MFRKAYHSMRNFHIVNETPMNEEIPFTYEDEHSSHNLNRPDNFKLYKIPRYLEKVIAFVIQCIFVSFLFVINSIIFNIIILPIKLIILLLKSIYLRYYNS